MTQNSDLPQSEAAAFEPSLDWYHAQLQRPDLTPADRVHLLSQQGQQLHQRGRYEEAIAAYDQALQQAQPPSPVLWTKRGDALHQLKRYGDACTSYANALAEWPDHVPALNGQTYALAMQRQLQPALQSSDRAIALAPESADAWLCRGVVFFQQRRYAAAIDCCDRALALQPDYAKAWYNRGVILLRSGQDEAALHSFEQATRLAPSQAEPWYPLAWVYQGYGLIRAGQFHGAIAACDRALALTPTSYPAALYRLVGLIMTGQVLSHLAHPHPRAALGHTLRVVAGALKYRLLVLVGAIALLVWGQGVWIDRLKQALPYVLSLGILLILVIDLWQHRSRLRFVRQTYFGHGILAYARATGILFATLTTYALTSAIAPPFLQWGWATWVFGQPGNILFQPFNLLQTLPIPLSRVPLTGLIAHGPLSLGSAIASILQGFTLHPLPIRTLLILGFWLILVLGIPFWANLEERIFRRGANTWPKIGIRSVQFGLVHLTAGIPLLAGIVLIVPGFLFACRYKYVHDRCLKQGYNAQAAQTAGVEASTADHAIYNGILVTLVVMVLIGLGG